MRSREYLALEEFLRTTLFCDGEFGIPMILPQELPSYENLQVIPINNVRMKASRKLRPVGIHFFTADSRFIPVFLNPRRYLKIFVEYAFIFSPDFSIYPEMSKWRQIASVGMSRWCGAYWQENGLTVIPTISWGQSDTFDFCFNGVMEGSPVAVSTLGCKSAKTSFMRGYDAMLERLHPSHIICFDKPFKEMRGNVHYVQYVNPRRGEH